MKLWLCSALLVRRAFDGEVRTLFTLTVRCETKEEALGILVSQAGHNYPDRSIEAPGASEITAIARDFARDCPEPSPGPPAPPPPSRPMQG